MANQTKHKYKKGNAFSSFLANNGIPISVALAATGILAVDATSSKGAIALADKAFAVFLATLVGYLISQMNSFGNELRDIRKEVADQGKEIQGVRAEIQKQVADTSRELQRNINKRLDTILVAIKTGNVVDPDDAASEAQ